MYSLDIVVPVYGQPDLLRKCLWGVKGIQGANIIIVDDSSPDRGAIEAVVRNELGLPLFRMSRNSGFPATVNKGVSKGKAPLILVLNSDVVIDAAAIQVLIGEFNDPAIGIAAPMLLFAEGSKAGPVGKIQHVGMAFDITGRPKHLFMGWDPSNPRAAQRRDTLPAVTGACFMTRRAIWNALGGFNETYGRGTYEDMEYCLRTTRELKLKIVCNPAAIGVHHVGASAMADGRGYNIAVNDALFRGNVAGIGGVLHNDYLFW